MAALGERRAFFRIECDRAVEIRDRLLEFSGHPVGHAAPEIGNRVVRVQADRAVDIGRRLIELFEADRRHAARRQQLRVVRLQLDQRIHVRPALGETVQCEQRDGTQSQRGFVTRIAGQDLVGAMSCLPCSIRGAADDDAIPGTVVCGGEAAIGP